MVGTVSLLALWILSATTPGVAAGADHPDGLVIGTMFEDATAQDGHVPSQSKASAPRRLPPDQANDAKSLASANGEEGIPGLPPLPPQTPAETKPSAPGAPLPPEKTPTPKKPAETKPIAPRAAPSAPSPDEKITTKKTPPEKTSTPTKPAETKPAETKPAEIKPAETKPGARSEIDILPTEKPLAPNKQEAPDGRPSVEQNPPPAPESENPHEDAGFAIGADDNLGCAMRRRL